MKKQWKKLSRLFALAMVIVMVLTGCGMNDSDVAPAIKQGQSDVEYVKNNGKLVVGITDFAPMDYRDGENWKGFDAELAKGFADSLGVSLEFVEIDWDEKTELLEIGKIDCIWNGMTMTEELKQSISCSEAYLSNAQVVVLRKEEMSQYNTTEACQHLLFAVEAGSTGQSLLKDKHYRYTSYSTQMEALQSVREKKADATVIDIIMAAYYTEEGQKFDDLGFDISLNNEKICIGFRKESDLTEEANEFLKASYEDGTIADLAEKYKIENAILQS